MKLLAISRDGSKSLYSNGKKTIIRCFKNNEVIEVEVSQNKIGDNIVYFENNERIKDCVEFFTKNCINLNDLFVESAAFSPDGRILALGFQSTYGTYEPKLRLFNTRNGNPITTWIAKEHYCSIHSVAFSPCGNYFASGDGNGKITLHDCRYKFKIISEFEHPEECEGDPIKSHVITKDQIGSVFTLAFSPDSKMLASGSADETVRVWSTESLECIKVLEFINYCKVPNYVMEVEFIDDGKYLAARSLQRDIIVWQNLTFRLIINVESQE